MPRDHADAPDLPAGGAPASERAFRVDLPGQAARPGAKFGEQAAVSSPSGPPSGQQPHTVFQRLAQPAVAGPTASGGIDKDASTPVLSDRTEAPVPRGRVSTKETPTAVQRPHFPGAETFRSQAEGSSSLKAYVQAPPSELSRHAPEAQAPATRQDRDPGIARNDLPRAATPAPIPIAGVVPAGGDFAIAGKSEAGEVSAVEVASTAQTQELRGTQTDPLTETPQAPPKRETATAIARQIAEALQRSPDRALEINLNPEELGRVRLGLAFQDGTITVLLDTARPETLDLMRRHLDLLAQEFRALGYTHVAFDFGSADREEQRQTQPGSAPEDAPSKPDSSSRPTVAAGRADGLDIRL
ncbi:MAG: flagellar hook-length control protein FliK [Paracoccaceae bacterium]